MSVSEYGHWPIDSDQEAKLKELEKLAKGRPDLEAPAVRATTYRSQQKLHGEIRHTREDCPKRAAFFKELHASQTRKPLNP